MKKQTAVFSKITKEQFEKLTTVVNETLAPVCKQVKTFNTADLWNIQRKSRTIMNRRSFVQ